MKFQLSAGITTAVAALLWMTAAQSAVLLDTFNPGNTFDTEIAYTVGNTGVGTVTTATPFTLSAAAIINHVAVAAMAEKFTLTITGDAAGTPNMAPLATVSSEFTGNGIIEFNPFIALPAGTYWLVMAAGAPEALGGWYLPYEYWDGTDQYGPVLQSETDGATWEFGHSEALLPAYRIGVTEHVDVPEPGTMALIGPLLVSMGLLRRRPAGRHFPGQTDQQRGRNRRAAEQICRRLSRACR